MTQLIENLIRREDHLFREHLSEMKNDAGGIYIRLQLHWTRGIHITVRVHNVNAFLNVSSFRCFTVNVIYRFLNTSTRANEISYLKRN